MQAAASTLEEHSRPGRERIAGRRRRPAVRFGLHYLEMVAVMFVGMGVLGGALLLAAAALGFGPTEIREDAPAAFLAGMGLSMTAPMVWWMRRRGHSTAANAAMAASMALTTVAAVALLPAGGDLDAALTLQHTAMFPAMFAAMLLHRGEYTGHDHAR
jgi:flagellar biosynthetic protein FliP